MEDIQAAPQIVRLFPGIFSAAADVCRVDSARERHMVLAVKADKADRFAASRNCYL